MSESSGVPARPRLTRSDTDRMVGGVCGGLAAHLGIDPVVLRVLLVVGAVFSTALVLAAYVLLWLVLPPEGEERPRDGWQWLLLAALLVIPAYALGGAVLARAGAPELLLAVVVAAVVVAGTRRRGERTASAPLVTADAPAPPEDDTVATEPRVPAWWHERPPPKEKPPYSPLARATVGGAFVLSGLAVLAGVPLRSVVSLALAVVGGGMLVGTVRGRGRPLIPVAVVLGGALAVTHFATVPEATASRGTYLRPSSQSSLGIAPSFGAVTIDLTEMQRPRESGFFTAHGLSVAAGRLVVIVPRGMDVRVRASVDVGTLTTYGRVQRGVRLLEEGQLLGGPGQDALWLHLHVGVGQLEVRYA